MSFYFEKYLILTSFFIVPLLLDADKSQLKSINFQLECHITNMGRSIETTTSVPLNVFLVDIGKWRRKKNLVKSDGYVYLHCKQTFLFFIWLLQALFEQLYKPNYLLMSIARGFNGSVNVFRKLWLSITISPIIHNFSAFFLKYFFVGIYILNKKI